MIATRDISAVAAAELLNSEFTGKQTRELLGQRDVSMKEVAAILGKVIGRAGLQYVQLPEDAARKAMVQFGLTRDLTDLLLEMVDALSRGHMKALEPRSARNTTPTSYEAFAMEEFLPRFQQDETLAA